MNVKAPDIYAVTDTELAVEMRFIDIASSTSWQGPITIITGVRCLEGEAPQPVFIIESKGRSGIHFIGLPGST